MLQNLNKKLKDQRGFTLIELLAVIVILGIIAAIAVPSIMGIINKSKNDAKVAEAIQIINAAKLDKAAHSDRVKWTNTELKDTVENVKDDGLDYEVNYDSTNGYSILKHDAAAVITGSVTTDAYKGAITEKQLLDNTK